MITQQYELHTLSKRRTKETDFQVTGQRAVEGFRRPERPHVVPVGWFQDDSFRTGLMAI